MANGNHKNHKIKQGRDTATGRFIEGNPGKPKGAKNYTTLLEEALGKEAQKAGKTYWECLASMAYRRPQVAIAILKKFIPDRQHTELETKQPQEIDMSGLTTEELKAIAYSCKIENKKGKK